MKKIRLKIPASVTLARPRSPFTDYFRMPRGGAHRSRVQQLEIIQRREQRRAGLDWR